MSLTYSPDLKEIKDSLSGKKIDFYCGKEFNETAIVLSMLSAGYLSLQDAYIDMMEIMQKNNKCQH